MARRIDSMTPDEIARYIAETAIVMSDGYKASVHCEHCDDGATAANNAGFFMLKGLGYETDEIKQMFAEIRKT